MLGDGRPLLASTYAVPNAMPCLPTPMVVKRRPKSDRNQMHANNNRQIGNNNQQLTSNDTPKYCHD